MRTKLMTVLVVVTLGLAGCENTGQKQGFGTLLGAGIGALAGSQIGSGRGQLAAVAVGTLLGAAIGNQIGASLDQQDMALAKQAEFDAHSAPTGQAIVWDNPETGNSGTVTPVRNGTDPRTGDFCREYQTEIIVGGEVQSGYGTACQRPDGSWEIVG